MAAAGEPRGLREPLPAGLMKDSGGADPIETMNDDTLTRYLLGALPEAHAEHVDELSVVDDELAARLRQVEDDLLDAYASGALTGERLAHFESHYLASPRRRTRVAFARRLMAAVDSEAPPNPRPVTTGSRTGTRMRGWLPASLAAAAVLFLSLGAFLVVQNVQKARLRSGLLTAQRDAAAEHDRAEAAVRRLDEHQRAAAMATPATPVIARRDTLVSIALVLVPQTRSAGPVPMLSVTPGARAVPLDLQIDGAVASSYGAALKDPATNEIVWRSAPLPTPRRSEHPSISVLVPATLLKTQHYAVDLFARTANGNSQLAGTYAFEVVRR